jgi:hypothetical protein
MIENTEFQVHAGPIHSKLRLERLFAFTNATLPLGLSIIGLRAGTVN